MSEIIEVLGEKKFFGSRNNELKTRVVFEENKKTRYENNLFFDISQQDQYINEKTQSSLFRIHGKINPIFNLDLYKKSTRNQDAPVEINKNLFEFNLDNWSIVILKSKQIESSVNINGKQLYSKGVKVLDYQTDTNDTIVDLDLRKGLPGRYYVSKINTDNLCIFLPLNHNLKIGDRVKIDSLDVSLLDSGLYEIVDTVNNMIYINATPIKTTLNESFVFNKGVVSKSVYDFIDVRKNNELILEERNKQVIDNLVYNLTEVNEIINTNRAKVQTLIRPDFYITKILENELLEYYVKTLEVINIIDNLDQCAFSINNFNQPYYNFFVNGDIDIQNFLNNKNEPITDIYIGVIKKSTPTGIDSISTIESHFGNYIENVENGYGLERHKNNIKIGDVFLHSICENTTENLEETEISFIKHRFIHRNILFNYNPFTKINLKIKSPYIEDNDVNENIPNYAIYSRQREKYIWRDIFDVGVSDEDGNVIDFPFTNGAFYVYSDINLYLTPETMFTRKYVLNGDTFTNEFEKLFGNINLNENESSGIKPYIKFIDTTC